MITGEIEIKTENDEFLFVEGDANLLRTVKKLINKNEVNDAVNSILRKNLVDDVITFYINKQAAYHNILHIIDEDLSVLNDIEVKVYTDHPDGFIEWFVN